MCASGRFRVEVHRVWVDDERSAWVVGRVGVVVRTCRQDRRTDHRVEVVLVPGVS